MKESVEIDEDTLTTNIREQRLTLVGELQVEGNEIKHANDASSQDGRIAHEASRNSRILSSRRQRPHIFDSDRHLTLANHPS